MQRLPRACDGPGRLPRIILRLMMILAAAAAAGAASRGVGARWPELTVAGRTYRDVEVRSVSPQSVVILHAEGLSSLRLRDLPSELQVQFGYSAAAEREAEAQQRARQAEVAARLQQQRHDRAASRQEEQGARFERLLQQFGHPPVVAAEVDLRPRFIELALGVKDQGRRPSCAVFAVVSALEYQAALLDGAAEKLSEEYLIWATRQVTRRIPLDPEAAAVAGDEAPDEGFALAEVVAALRVYGIPRQSSMPNTFGSRMRAIAAPSREVLAEARTRRRVYVHQVPGRDGETLVQNLVHALNAGLPVAIGLRWPHARTLRSGFLSGQRPVEGYAHAVTVVGYTAPEGRLEEAVFLFKNSYGARWGQGGYGRVAYEYLRGHLLDAVVLEVQPGLDTPPAF